jgi:phosphatidylglycerophosphatase A
LAILTFIGIWSSGKAEAIFKEKDSHKIVIDEIVGYLYAMILVPTTLSMLIIAFFIFRIFDVLKPFPLRRLQRLHGGIGVMIDDILAGLYSCVLIHVFFL